MNETMRPLTPHEISLVVGGNFPTFYQPAPPLAPAINIAQGSNIIAIKQVAIASAAVTAIASNVVGPITQIDIPIGSSFNAGVQQ